LRIGLGPRRLAGAMSDLRHGPYCLRPPASPDDWEVYHRIRRDVMLEAQKYALEHADDIAPGRYALLLCRDDEPIGSIRIDITETGEAGLRLVAIHPNLQGRGCGRVLLQLAETFARARGCAKTVLYATPEAVGFYSKAGYTEEDWDDVYISGIVQMAKPLC
jgi:GNAT superfamily N-acetyltransferase